MPIKIACPSCQKNLNVPDNAAGKRGKCPACQTIIAVPEPHASPPQQPPPDHAASLPQPEGIDDPDQTGIQIANAAKIRVAALLGWFIAFGWSLYKFNAASPHSPYHLVWLICAATCLAISIKRLWQLIFNKNKQGNPMDASAVTGSRLFVVFAICAFFLAYLRGGSGAREISGWMMAFQIFLGFVCAVSIIGSYIIGISGKKMSTGAFLSTVSVVIASFIATMFKGAVKGAMSSGGSSTNSSDASGSISPNSSDAPASTNYSGSSSGSSETTASPAGNRSIYDSNGNLIGIQAPDGMTMDKHGNRTYGGPRIGEGGMVMDQHGNKIDGGYSG